MAGKKHPNRRAGVLPFSLTNQSIGEREMIGSKEGVSSPLTLHWITGETAFPVGWGC